VNASSKRNPTAGRGRAGISSFRSRIDNPENRPPEPAKQARDRLRRQCLVSHLHRLGPSPLGHFLREIENGASIADHLNRYSRIDPDFVRALGGCDFVEFLHVVDGGRP
jgi:hypothetical protein